MLEEKCAKLKLASVTSICQRKFTVFGIDFVRPILFLTHPDNFINCCTVCMQDLFVETKDIKSL